MAATPASMLRIISQGLQDRERLNTPAGNPSVGFYTSVLRRRTRWASRWRRVDFDHAADFGRSATVTIPQLGELITRATLIVELPDIVTPQAGAAAPHWSWTNGIGHAICSNITFSINGQPIDQLDSHLLEVLDEQTGAVEHFDSTNAMIGRNPVDYSDTDTTATDLTLEIVPPFWWNRGPGPQALPIQALAKDQVQITVNFRPIQQCVYTSTRASATFPGAVLPTFAGCPLVDGSNNVVGAMPTAWHLNAFWIIEYVSLEDREAAAFRQADLEIPIEQHVAVAPFDTEGRTRVRIPLNEGGLIRDMTWIAQRRDAADYNAYFLFARDLSGGLWPDAQIPNWDYGDGYIRPGFSDRRADPISTAAMFIRGKSRFDHEGTSFFRSLIPALGCRRTPLIDRYIYRYDFGFWPTGGLAEAMGLPVDEVRGAANWDKLPDKELVLTMNTDSCRLPSWSPTEDPILSFNGDRWTYLLSDMNLDGRTDAFRFRLRGASPSGRGAFVEGVVDLQGLRANPTFRNIVVRTCAGGSAALALQFISGTGFRYEWLAVAGAGGEADTEARSLSGTSLSFVGGNAGNVLTIGQQGNGGPATHANTTGFYDVLYENTQVGTRSFYGFFSPLFRINCGGTIRGWQILSEIYSSSLANYIFITPPSAPQYSYQVDFLNPPPETPIQWHSITMSTIPSGIPIPPGSDILVYHTSLASNREYNSAQDSNGRAVVRIPVYNATVSFGGGGGGRGPSEGVGLPDGAAMTTTEAFVLSSQQVGGAARAARGGDGYYGGGSGCGAGGGGGSYISRYVTQTYSDVVGDSEANTDSLVTITPLRRIVPVNPPMDIRIWLTRINMLRITGGRGALMFTS
jgi:hypothetical protein